MLGYGGGVEVDRKIDGGSAGGRERSEVSLIISLLERSDREGESMQRRGRVVLLFWLFLFHCLIRTKING